MNQEQIQQATRDEALVPTADRGSYVNTIKDDGVLGRLNFVSKGKDHQVYGLAIPNTMLTDEIKKSDTYQTFLALSTGLIPPNKSRGKGSKGKKATITPKKKGSIIVDDNIIPEPDPTSVEESNESDGEPAKRTTGRRRPTEEEQLADDQRKQSKPTGKLTEYNSSPQAQVKELVLHQSAQSDDEDRSIDIKETDDEETESNNDDQVMDDAEKPDKEKDADKVLPRNDQAEDDQVRALTNVTHKEKSKFLLSTSSQSMSSNYGNQFLNTSSDISLIGTIQEDADTEINSLLDVQIQQEIPTAVSAPLLDVLVLEDLERIFNAWTKVDHSEAIKASVQANLINAVKNQLPKVVKYIVEPRMESTVQNVLQKDKVDLEQHESQKDASEIHKIKLEHVSKQKWPKHSTTPLDKTTKIEYKQKDILFKMMMASKSSEKHPTHKALYEALIQSLIKETVAKPSEEVTIDAEEKIINNDVVNDADHHKMMQYQRQKMLQINIGLNNLQGLLLPIQNGTRIELLMINQNKHDLVSTEKDPLTFDELMATPIDFSMFAMNRLKLAKITKANLVGLVYKLLKGT
ncbi:hypothetical protein Tco_1254749 [Tanacetum coccineum]